MRGELCSKGVEGVDLLCYTLDAYLYDFRGLYNIGAENKRH